MTESENNRFSACLDSLRALSQSLKSPIAIVGGLAGIRHGSGVVTLDVDVVIAKEKLNAIPKEAPRFGFEVTRVSPNGWHQLVWRRGDLKVDVDVIPEGQKSPRDPAHAPPNPSPQDLGVADGLDYADFAPWVVLKLIAGRDKDRYHLIEVFKHATEIQRSQVVQRLRGLDPTYLAEFERLVRAAEEEGGMRDW